MKTIIKPSKAAQIRQGQRLRDIVRRYRSAPQADLICRLNPVIRGWSNYYSTVCSKAVFSAMENRLYQKLRSWAYQRHANKGRRWIVRKYWRIEDGQGWLFAPRGSRTLALAAHASTPIRRHIKVQGSHSPYDGDWVY